MTGTGEIQCQGKPEMYFQKQPSGVWVKTRADHVVTWDTYRHRGKKQNRLLCQEFQALKCFSAKVHIFLSWQGVQQMDTQPACPPMPREPWGVLCAWPALTVYVKTKSSLFNQSWSLLEHWNYITAEVTHASYSWTTTHHQIVDENQ